MKVLCVVSTATHEPFQSILHQGTLPYWAEKTTEIQVCTLECSWNSKTIRRIDFLRERIRSSKSRLARLGQGLDLLLFPLAWYIPKMRLSKYENSLLRIRVIMPEILSLYRWKYLAALKFFVENTEMDYLYTVNSSCYVREKALMRFIEANQPVEYGGSLIIDPKSGEPFISGANRLISREVAKEILRNRYRWPLHLTEDISLGRMTAKLGLIPRSMPTLNLSSANEIQILKHEEIEQNFHFRLKGFNSHERIDTSLFKELSKKLDI